ncbi:MAG: TetR/AcrR family transcriptional regulator [Fidelibacterota bacterium]
MAKKQERYNQILQAAYDLLESGNFQNMTTARIAALAGVAEGTIYRYFKNKRHLLFEVLDFYGQTIADRIFSKVSSRQNLKANLRHFVDGFFLSLQQDVHFFRVMHKVLSEIDDPEIYPLLRDTFIRHSKSIREVFEWARQKGEIHLTDEETDNLVHGLWGIADGFMIRVVLQIHTPILKREVNYMVSVFTRQLFNEE